MNKGQTGSKMQDSVLESRNSKIMNENGNKSSKPSVHFSNNTPNGNNNNNSFSPIGNTKQNSPNSNNNSPNDNNNNSPHTNGNGNNFPNNDGNGNNRSSKCLLVVILSSLLLIFSASITVLIMLVIDKKDGFIDSLFVSHTSTPSLTFLSSCPVYITSKYTSAYYQWKLRIASFSLLVCVVVSLVGAIGVLVKRRGEVFKCG